jgi:hypothetical protein
MKSSNLLAFSQPDHPPVAELLDSLPNLRFDSSAPEVEIRGRDLRAPASLPVVFDVRPAWR